MSSNTLSKTSDGSSGSAAAAPGLAEGKCLAVAGDSRFCQAQVFQFGGQLRAFAMPNCILYNCLIASSGALSERIICKMVLSGLDPVIDQDQLKVFNSGVAGVDFNISEHRPAKTIITSFLTDDLQKLIERLQLTGFSLNTESGTAKPLTPPENFTVQPGNNPGEVLLYVNTVPNARTYLFLYGPSTMSDEAWFVAVSEEKFRGLLEAAPDAMVIADAGGNIVLVNRQTEILMGYKRDELFQQPSEMLVPPEFRDTFMLIRAAYLSNPGFKSMDSGLETWVLTKDNKRVPVEISLSPLSINNELLVLASLRDTTVRRQTAALLEKTRINFEMLVKGVKDYAIFMVDKHGLIISWNEGAEKIKGYTAEEVLGKSTAIFYTDADIQAGQPGLNLELARENGTYETEGLRITNFILQGGMMPLNGCWAGQVPK
ncbi:PAS domain S-box protein [Ostertagia ostertagi]